MNTIKKSLLIVLTTVIIMSESCAKVNENSAIVCFETNNGKILVKLYPETSKHRENFLKLVNEGF